MTNADQATAWNEGSGLNWVALDTELEHVHGAVTPALLAHAQPRPGERIIDIGCGSGAVTQAAADAAPGGHALGVDISAPLLDLARQKRSGAVSFALGDAQTHPFEPGAADLVVSRFGVMFFDDPVAAFSNIRAALRPGGRIALACWAPLSENPWFAIPGKATAARMGPVEPPPPHAPGPGGLSDTAHALGILDQAGFTGSAVSTEALTFTHPAGASGAAATMMGVGPAARIIKERGGTQADFDAILAAVEAGYAAHARGGTLALPARVHIYTAQNPG